MSGLTQAVGNGLIYMWPLQVVSEYLFLIASTTNACQFSGFPIAWVYYFTVLQIWGMGLVRLNTRYRDGSTLEKALPSFQLPESKHIALLTAPSSSSVPAMPS